MKIVVRVKLLPDAVQAPAVGATLYAVNDAANWVSVVAYEHGVPREYELRKHTYAELKARGLGAQAAQHTIKKVRDAYTTLKANIKAGNLGKPGSKRRVKAESKPIVFRTEAAHPYDDRCLSWQYDAQTVSMAKRAGVPLVYVDPAYTSQQCSECGHIDRKNRVDQATFACRSCGALIHADDNASRNIAVGGEAVWIAGRESRVPATP